MLLELACRLRLIGKVQFSTLLLMNKGGIITQKASCAQGCCDIVALFGIYGDLRERVLSNRSLVSAVEDQFSITMTYQVGSTIRRFALSGFALCCYHLALSQCCGFTTILQMFYLVMTKKLDWFG